MTIRSIDMQVLVQKVGDVARIQQTQQIENNSRQQEFAQQINQQTEKNVKTVNQALRNEHAIVHEKHEKEEKDKKNKTKKGKNKTAENNESIKKDGSKNNNHLDIIV